MRPPSDMPRRPVRAARRRIPTGRGRSILVIGAFVLFVLITSLRGIAGFYTDYLWFDSLGLSGVWRGILGAKGALALIFSGLFFAVLWVNLLIAERLAPKLRPAGPEEELVERYHELVAGRTGLVRTAVAAFFALLAGGGVSSQWNEWVLFTNRVDFGEKDATFGNDLGFYVFQLPFLTFVASWLFSALVIVLVVTILAHYLNGGIRLQLPGQRATPQVKAHVSVLLGVLALVQAAKYWLDQYELVFSTRGTVNGATYTDVNVQKKVIYLLVMISLFAFVLFIANIFRRGWVLPVLAVGLWAFVAILAGGAVPAFVQRFRVQPTESSKEAPYIEQNIEATRKAMNLDQNKPKPFEANQELTSDDLEANVETVRNIRLWDPEHLQTSFQQLQGQRAFYDIGDVDVDRYEINGETIQTMLASRNLDSDGVSQTSWEARHLTYTHGYGSVLAPANAKNTNGDPVLKIRDIPLRALDGAPDIKEPGIYIGEGLDGYVIVDTARQEVDFQDASGETQYTTYKGEDGVRIGSGVNGFVRQAAFALRYGDINPLISTSVKPRSKVLLQRDVRDRVEAVAPFLQFDNDPYSVVTEDGKVVYIVDGYTATNRYPNAQRADTADLPAGSGLRGRNFNYVRNSVKAVVDAYDGTVTMYVWDDEDPLIEAYAKAFPELFSDEALPEDLEAHVRYPEDLFRVQTSMWGRYHVDNADDFYNSNDEWAVALDPDVAESQTSTTSSTTTQNTVVESGKENRIDPYYQLMRLPDEEEESFLIMRPFVPASSDDRNKLLTAFMVAKPNGEIETFEMPTARLPNGPSVAAAAMQQDESFSEQQTLLTRAGSEVEFGNMLLVPIEQSLLYVRPVFVSAENTRIPQLKFVLVSFQPSEESDEELSVAFGTTLKDALTTLFGASPDTLEEGGEPVEPPGEPGEPGDDPGEEEPGDEQPTETGDQLIEQLASIYAEAEALKGEGDVVAYIGKLEEAGAVVDRLEALRQERTGDGATPPEGGGDGTTTSSTTPTTAPP